MTVAGEVQRQRIVSAMVLVVGEQGFANTTVTTVCSQARVSRSTFYGHFACLRECFLTVIDEGYLGARLLICQAFEGQRCWRDGVRAALSALLGSFDEDPLLARVWFVETLAAGAWALERRERHVAALTATIVERWPAPGDVRPYPLAAPGVMEAVLGALRTHLLGGREEPMIGLLGPLMGLVTAVYLDPGEVAAEIERCEMLTRGILAKREHAKSEAPLEIPGVLRDPRAHRARGCLLYLLGYQGASNRQVARAVGIGRDDQISTMLARLARMELVVKRQGRPGAPNAWSLSPHGLLVAQALQALHQADIDVHTVAADHTSLVGADTRHKEGLTIRTP